jgi:RNA polymerase sigma-70 factor, ECF subfamily
VLGKLAAARQPGGLQCVTPDMSAATLAAVYNMPVRLDRRSAVQTTADDTSHTMEQFLASVERKAFKIAQLGLRHDEDALDAVQDAMLKLVQSYSRHPPADWKPLFYRILENGIRDMQRRRTVRGRVMSWLPARIADEDEDFDPIAAAPSTMPTPLRQLELDEAISALEEAIRQLPHRQQQAFLLRNFEGLDVLQTATAMGCSEGSVKTHYFRALEALRARVGEFW